MAINIRKFKLESEFVSVYNGDEYIEPWVSLCTETSGMAYNKAYLKEIEIKNLKMVGNVPASGATVNKDNCTYVVNAVYSNYSREDITEQAEVTGSLVVEASQIEQSHLAGVLTLTATYLGKEASASVKVYQEAFVPSITAITIDNLTWNVDIPSNGGTASKDNCTYVVTAHYDVEGMTEDVTKLASVTGSLVVEASQETERHAAGTLTLTAEYSGLTDSADVTVYQEKYSNYLKFKILSGGNIAFGATSYNEANTATPLTIEYKKNDGEWTSLTSTLPDSSSSPATPEDMVNSFSSKFSVDAGDVVMFRGNNQAYTFLDKGEFNTFLSTAELNVEGNIMSLIDKNNFESLKELTTPDTFFSLFSGCYGLISAENLLLPATTLTEGCYDHMFYGCTSLKAAPALPATTLAQYCYYGMFEGCTSLTAATKLPATTLTDSCYESMFNGCTSLTTAPELPARTLANSCYSSMFRGCTSLTTAPELPATTLMSYCYYKMFNGCTNLNYIKCLATDISAPDSTTQWVENVAATGIFVKSPNMFSWTNDTDGIPYNWIIKGHQIPYTADTSTVAASGETRTITIDTTGLIDSSITVSIEGATGVTYAYGNGVVTVTFPENEINPRNITVNIDAEAINGETPKIKIVFKQKSFLQSATLTFNIISGGTIMWVTSNTALTRTIEYKKNNGEWTSITSNTGSSAPSISVNAGDVVRFRGNNATYGTSKSSYNSFSGSTAKFELEGNVMSLIDGANFATATTLSTSYTFNGLFTNCTGLTSAEKLILPATALASSCYEGMFQGCTSLATAPLLPATKLADSCYEEMFSKCTNLTTAPELPAITLRRWCYYGMFEGCTSLTAATKLPATTLTDSCYDEMFNGCTSLTQAPELPARTLANSCYSSMFRGCTSLTTAPELPATTLANDCYWGMFYNCASLTTAPELPATTLAGHCYEYMFYGCTSLITAPSELPATTLANYCYEYMFQNCTSLTTAPTLPATRLTRDCYSYMFHGCPNLNYIKAMFTTTPGSSYTSNWLSGVASSGTFEKNPSATWDSSISRGTSTVPEGWTITNAAS